MKLPYKSLLVYCVVSGFKYSETSDWMNGVLGLPIDESLYIATKKRKFAKQWSQDLIDYVNESKNEIDGIVKGYGRKEIFINMVCMMANGMKCEEAAAVMKENFNVDFSEDDIDLFTIIIFNVADWDCLDWFNYLSFISSLPDNPLAQNLSMARFSSRDEMMYQLGIGISDFAQDALLAHKKQAKIYHHALEGQDSDEIATLGNLYQSSLAVLADLAEKGFITPHKAEEAITFAREKAKHDPITDPKFKDIELGGDDGNT